VIKFAICNEIFQGWPLEEAMRFAAKMGYSAIEIAPFTIANDVTQISAAHRQQIREQAEHIGIVIAGLHWVLVKTEGLHLTDPNARSMTRTSDYLCSLVDFCADIGGTRIVVGSPKQRNVLDDVTYEKAWNTAVEVFHAAVIHAQQRGIIICFEPLAPSETNFINTAEEAIAFTKQFNSPAFKIILDVKALCSEAKSIPEIIHASTPHFAHFHANDRNLKGPGFGDVDFHPIAAALREVGYEGYVSVEVFNFQDGPEKIAMESLRYLRSTFD
jgi:sugar phosphate isomerase/epimerase